MSKFAMAFNIGATNPWATVLGLGVDKFGVSWALYYQE